MNITDFLILGFATWRLSSMFANDNESGPFGILDKFRNWSFKYTSLLECVWCTSVWVAILIFIVYQYIPVAVYILAISTVAILVDRWSG